MKKILLVLLLLIGISLAQDGTGYDANITDYDVLVLEILSPTDIKFNLDVTSQLIVQWSHNNPAATDVYVNDTTIVYDVAAVLTVQNAPEDWNEYLYTYTLSTANYNAGAYRIYVRSINSFGTSDWVYNSGSDFLFGRDPSNPTGVNVSGN